MSKAEYKGQQPDSLFVVTYDNYWRVFVSEGQALRCYTEKVEAGLKPAIYQYADFKIIAKVSN